MSSRISHHDDITLPIPISLTIYNRLPFNLVPTNLEGIAPSNSKKWFRPDYSVKLLFTLRLEVIVKDDKEKQERIIFSSTIEKSNVNTIWDHMDELVPFHAEEWEQMAGSTEARIIYVDSNQLDSILVDSIPLHPQSLCKLFRGPKIESFYMKSKSSIPSSLPPNAILITYSDGVIRVESSLYELLSQNGILPQSTSCDQSLNHHQHQYRDFGNDDDDDVDNQGKFQRFDDNVFDMLLGQPVVNNNKNDDSNYTYKPESLTSMSLLEMDDESLATPIENSYSNNNFAAATMPTENECNVEQLEEEHDSLLNMIHTQEILWKSEFEGLISQRTHLQATIKEVKHLEEEIQRIREFTQTVSSKDQHIVVAIDLCQRQLVKELCQIYPIVSKNQDRFWIANAELPLDLFRGLVHEDEISAALGYIAHSLSLLSKYLHVVLRHRIICNSSRSGIRDADGSLLPLFLSRSSERCQIERGMILLHRNISCLAQSRGIVLSESHILAKLNQVYEIVLAK